MCYNVKKERQNSIIGIIWATILNSKPQPLQAKVPVGSVSAPSLVASVASVGPSVGLKLVSDQRLGLRIRVRVSGFGSKV